MVRLLDMLNNDPARSCSQPQVDADEAVELVVDARTQTGKAPPNVAISDPAVRAKALDVCMH